MPALEARVADLGVAPLAGREQSQHLDVDERLDE